MSDDIWRRRDDDTGDGGDDYGTDFGSDFGKVQFADDPSSEPSLSFANSDTGDLPHWTEPPTGEIPRFNDGVLNDDADDDTDVWATFQQPSTPTPRPDRLSIGTDPTGEPRRQMRDVSGEYSRDYSREYADITGGQPRPSRGPDPRSQQVRRAPQRAGRSSVGRDMPTAVATGLILGAVFVGTIMWRPAAVMVLVLAALAMASVEFFSKVTERGYRPATLAGIAACVAAPLAAYWIGDAALPLVVTFGFLATSVGFLGATSVQSGPMPNVAITSMAVVWIGLLGSYAALILRFSTNSGLPANIGTDTLFLVVAGVIANDVGALLVGSSAGRRPLREWVSPGKTVEGFVGGAIASIVVVMVIGTQSDTWNSFGEWLMLGVVIAVMGPLGDLVESMFKRNLDIKDFGTVVPGHGGVLDRFDSYLFVLPAAYYLLLVFEPWVS